MKTRIIFLLTLISCIVHAQENGGWTKPQINYDSLTTAFKERYKKPAKYCTSYSAFRNNLWIETEEIILQDFEDKKNIIDQCDQFRFKADSKELEKTLKNKALVVLFDDSLYFNCKMGGNKLRYRKGYIRAYRLQENGLCIPNTQESIRYKNMMGTAVWGVQGGIIGGAIIGGLVGGLVGGLYGDYDCVLLISEQDKGPKKINTDLMESLLSHSSEDLEEYKSIKKSQRTSARVVMYYLKKMDLIRPN